MKKIFLFTSIIFLAFSLDVFSQPINLSSTNITNTTVDLNWDASPCSGNVTLHYKVSGTGWPGTSINPAVSPYVVTGLSGNTDYEWRVKCSGSGNPWSPTQSFSTTGPVISNAFVSQPILCFGDYANDEMQVDVSQTVSPTTYSCVIGYYIGAFFVSYYSTNQTTATQLNLPGFLPSQNYFVRLVDSTGYYNANGGIGSGTSLVGIYDEFGPITFSEPSQLTANTSVVASNLCAGDCIAEEDLSITGGTGPYSFTINSGSVINLSAGVASYSFVALCADVYDIVVTDANGCLTSPSPTTFTISPISPIVPEGAVSLFNQNGYNVSCNGASDGSITAAASGGTGAFTYSLDGINFQSQALFPGLSAGTYTVTYQDANGCIATEQLTLSEPPPLSGTASVTQNVDCYGTSTGEITFTVDPSQPGVPAYQFSVDSGNTYQGSNIFTGLAGDISYPVMIEDNNGCQFTSTVYLAQPAQIIYSTTLSNYNGFQISCNGAFDGEITASATGGTGSFTYSIDGTNFQPLGIFSGLIEGPYTVTYQDATGCIETDLVTLTEPDVFSISYTVSNSIDCPGDCNGAISINPSYGVTPIWYSLDAGTQQTTPYFSGLCGVITNGSYTLDAIDDNGCTATDIVSIAEPTAFVYSTSSIPESCAPPNGQASISVTSGGTGGYLYEWDTNPVQYSSVANNLVAGDYTVTVTDGNSCSFTELVTVASSPGFTLSFIAASPCLGPNSGSATVSATGASAPLFYQWGDANGIPFTGETDSTLSNIPVGTYTVEVTDATSCTILGSVDVMPETNPIVFDTLIITSNSCYGVDDAQIEIIASGGAPPYSYSNGIIPSQTNPVFGYLAPNSYTITATDVNDCFVDTVIPIIYPDLLEVDSTHFVNLSCYGANDGEILSIDVLGGTGPFTYSVNGGPHYSNMAYFNGYGSGIYTVEVYDINNCVAADYIIIAEPNELVVNITTSGWVLNGNSGLYSYQIRCHGDNSGFANFAINGGTAPYTQNLYDATTGVLMTTTTLNSFTGLTAGEYDFEVIDANGCTYLETITFNEPPPIVHNFMPTHVTCNGWNNGSLTDSVYGGVGNATTYTYLWSNSETTYTINNIGIGEYFIEVRDENNCLSTDTFVIHDDNALAVSVNTLDVSCYDFCDAKIFTSPSGGVPDLDPLGNPVYYYQWDDILSQTTQTAIGLCADNNSDTAQYSCIITDAQGCADTIFATISQPDSLHVTASITSNSPFGDISCYGGSDGEAEAFVTGGTTPYNYVWDATPGLSTNNNLNAGMHKVIITDANGCMDSTEIILTQPTELTISVSQTNINCFGIYDGTMTADADGGIPFNGIPPMYDYSFSNGYNEQVDISTAIDLIPGLYTVIATDQNGCTVTSESIYISEPELLIGSIDSIVDESCNADNGELWMNVDQGTRPYTYTWSNGVSGVNDSTINSLSPGIYFLEVVDNNGCVINDTARVKGSDEVFLPGNIAYFDTTICLGESIIDLDIEEKEGFMYVWTNGNGTFIDTTIVNDLANDHADITVMPIDTIGQQNIYTLQITDIMNSCSYEVVATININFIVDPMAASEPGAEYKYHRELDVFIKTTVILQGDDIYLYSENSNGAQYTWTWANDAITNIYGAITVQGLLESGLYYLEMIDYQGCVGYDTIYVVVGVETYEYITPNGDGENDEWLPKDIQSYPDALLQVFNRWGGLVWEAQGGENLVEGWDGTHKGKELPVGSYYYIINLNTGDEPQTGPITIIR